MDARRVLSATGLVLLRVLLGTSIEEPRAQDVAAAACQGESVWQYESGTAGQTGFRYVLKINRCTGETWLMSAMGNADGDEKWVPVLNETKSKK